MAGPAVKGSEIINSQIAAITKINGKSDNEISDIIAFQNTLYELLGKDAPIEEVKGLLKKYHLEEYNFMTEEQKKNITDINEYAEGMAAMKSRQVNSKWFKYFIKYDPQPDITKLRCSVIALFGGKDVQVLSELNKSALDEAVKKSKAKYYSCKVFPEANHLFQEAGTGSPDEYYGLKKEFVPGFLEYILEEINKANKL